MRIARSYLAIPQSAAFQAVCETTEMPSSHPPQATPVYILWTDRPRARLAIVTPDGRRFEGPKPRGYLTKPGVLFNVGDEPSFKLGGNRRIAPNRHILSTAGGNPVATFTTRLVTSPFDARDRTILAPDGSVLATLRSPYQEGRWKRLRSALTDNYELTAGDALIGFVDRTRSPVTEPPTPTSQATRRLTLYRHLDPQLAVGVLVYVACVLDPSKTPG